MINTKFSVWSSINALTAVNKRNALTSFTSNAKLCMSGGGQGRLKRWWEQVNYYIKVITHHYELNSLNTAKNTSNETKGTLSATVIRTFH